MTAWETILEAPRRLGEAAQQARPQLRGIISPPRRLSPVSFAVLVVAILVGGMVGLLALTTVLQNQAFEVRAAQRVASELGYRASDLEAQVNRAKAPESLGRAASGLGMVPNPHAVFIDVRTGEVLGKPIAAKGDEIPSLKVGPVAVAEPAAPKPAASAPAAPADAAPADGTPADGAPTDPQTTDTAPETDATAHAAITPAGGQG